MATSIHLPDYYADLQVHPDADAEVIAAAYRQLMKKHHPDVAGDDPRRIAEHAARAKTINAAFAVLRDPERRREYDRSRLLYGSRTPPAGSAWYGSSASNAWRTNPYTTWRPSPPPGPTPEPVDPVDDQTETPAETYVVDPSPAAANWLTSPFSLLSAAYFLLPGPYEWEKGYRSELLTIGLLPIVGTAGFALFTGRLAPWIGTGLNATVIAAVVLLLCCLPLWSAIPRIALAAVPSVALLTGNLSPYLQQAHVPATLAWGAAALVSLALAARLYVFAVLPTLAACLLLIHFNPR